MITNQLLNARSSAVGDNDETMVKWVLAAHGRKLLMSGPILIEKSTQMTKAWGYSEFEARITCKIQETSRYCSKIILW